MGDLADDVRGGNTVNLLVFDVFEELGGGRSKGRVRLKMVDEHAGIPKDDRRQEKGTAYFCSPASRKSMLSLFFPLVREVASAITPVPGGVGPMTITMLLYNTLQSARTV
jgi:hypothetical protein